MKVLTLWQPWATLVVMGAKMIETRSYSTKFEGEVLIHASKKPVAPVVHQEYFSDMLSGRALPLGKIIGKVTIGGTFKTEDAGEYFLSPRYYGRFKTIERTAGFFPKNMKREMAFGDYTPGRYGWELSDPVEFTNRTPFTGGVGFTREFKDKICLVCGCTEDNCIACIQKTGKPCSWINKHLCSACVK